MISIKCVSPKKRVTREDIMANLSEELQRHHHIIEVNHIDSRDLPQHRPIWLSILKKMNKAVQIIFLKGFYTMSRDELLCLRKEATKLLDRTWI